ncbi:RNA polymerase sigma factor [Aquimarina algicola]|uniref:RNA polymerase sigma-70 factor n=1 Tax=Aquimarina algicola TaxID=2589995 RepID=A0A504J599_9FLAO|nr:RNA polymerase sigma-70 factor [Aquimarina algicola]TPN82773.1 RNA polymerase sigma-70 factor [Aquimarina algicola]
MDEKLIWIRIQNGDNQALELLFERYYRPLCSYALQFTKHMPDAEDIVQSVFIKLWSKREELHINTSLKAYLYKSVYHTYIDKSRKNKKRQEFLDTLQYEALLYQVDDDNDIFEKKLKKLNGLIANLPEKCKQILLLSKQENYKNREIAKKLNISIKTVEAQLRIAFQKIREGFQSDL